jgi:hypothetical protein
MRARLKQSALGLLVSASIFNFANVQAATSGITLDADDIGGTVLSEKGPEAGVWVIAQTTSTPTPLTKIVVTDDKGRFVLPDLPEGKYKLWVRGYGLADSTPIEAARGTMVDLKATVAKTPSEAAQIYPPNYWLSLIEVPPASDFPGTGPNGNGINPKFETQQHWMGQLKELCSRCHQLGDKATRELADIGDPIEAWSQRIHKSRPVLTGGGEGGGGSTVTKMMVSNMEQYGVQRGLQMFANWTSKIAAGALPPIPPRPTGVERNVVLTIWSWPSNGRFMHDDIATDKRDPTINANGPIYGEAADKNGLAVLDPVNNILLDSVPGAGGHTLAIDQKGRVWNTGLGGAGDRQSECTDGNENKFANYFPITEFMGMPARGMGRVIMYEPQEKKVHALPVCFPSHHLAFASDAANTLYFSGDTQVISWIDTAMYDKTGSIDQAQGWCPIVLDTNGDGKIDPDRTQWNDSAVLDTGTGSDGKVNGPVHKMDPKKDTRIGGFLYGMGVSPADGSVWFAKYGPLVPSGILRFERGKNPPQTCKSEYYEPPKLRDGSYAAFAARGIDVDSKGVAWVAFSSGEMGSFDRRKCKVLKGPDAIGQQCPEGWAFYDAPGPKIKGVAHGGAADYNYLNWVDQHDTLGLGKDVPMMLGTNSDSVLALMPDTKKWVVLRVPYPMGFFSRGMGGRIDDPKGGWKGRGLYANYAEMAPWHEEDGDDPMKKVVKFQMRPNPLAH